MSASSDWLDTQTQAQLAALPPEKLAPPVVAGYSLVLLERGHNRQRVDRTLQALVNDSTYSLPPCPCVVLQGLSLADALQGQFELICADSVSVFLDDDVLRDAKPSYLDGLFRNLRNSPEFELVTVCVKSIPESDRGEKFLLQFFGQIEPLPTIQVVARKKARIMRHWGSKLGAVIEIDNCTI